MTATLPYATGRRYLDADSHLMELPGWLAEFADPAIRDRIRPLHLGGAGKLAADAVERAEQRRGDDAAAHALEERLMSAKGWHALGAFDTAERSRALDLLGFDAQLVFSTFAATQFAGDDLELLYGGTRAHNRAMAAFCGDDPRLLPVAYAPWNDPEAMFETVVDALALGAAAVHLPSRPPRRGKGPSHPDYDPVWAALADASVPFVLHIGGAGRLIPSEFHDNGRPVSDFLGGGENVRAKDYMGVAHMTETFLAALIFDGVLERFPRLRGGSIEQGAMWVVPWIRRLDLAQRSFGRNEPLLRDLPKPPSEYVRDRLYFTPFPGEPVGWMIDQSGDELYCFSSDYPHPEGTKNPLERFEATLDSVTEAAKQRFYHDNLAAMLGR
ncbi:MAG TPA: amidohydrolase family protein [Acidimicrobiia bacterium]|jgi:predicted TIM-barrel fold metal-dependent hydrolase